MNNQHLILSRATLALQTATGLSVQYTVVAEGEGQNDSLPLRTTISSVNLPTIVKQNVTAHLISQVAYLREGDGDILLIAEVIPKEAKTMLRQLKVNYLDTDGNCFIQAGHHFIQIEGKKALVTPLTSKQPFTKSGLKVLFSLLTQPDAMNRTMRELARKTTLSVGAVQQSLKGLKELGYIESLTTGHQRLVQIESLQERWLHLYGTVLKPSLLIGRFRLPGDMRAADWRQIELGEYSYWSGEPAANALIKEPWPYKLTVYTTDERASWLQDTYHLIPDPSGLVEVNKSFWQPMSPVSGSVPIVPPLLIYADLLSTADARNLKSGRIIYQKYIQQR